MFISKREFWKLETGKPDSNDIPISLVFFYLSYESNDYQWYSFYFSEFRVYNSHPTPKCVNSVDNFCYIRSEVMFPAYTSYYIEFKSCFVS